MKKLLLLLIIPFLSFGQDLTYVPDDDFEQALILLGHDDVLDNYVLTNNISSLTVLNVSNPIGYYNNGTYTEAYLSISDLTGIEDFVSMTSLLFNYHNVTSIDVSNMLNLTMLYCRDNELIELDLSNNVNMTNLDCKGNNITNLNVANCPNMTNLYAWDNAISSIDVANMNNLQALVCHNNNLSQINMPTSTDLYVFTCNNNNLSQLDVSNNTSLIELRCSDNNISCVQVWDVTYAIEQEQCMLNKFCFEKDENTVWSLDCEYDVSVKELLVYKTLIKKVDILGRDTNSKGFNIEIYDDGSVEKKYIVE